MRGDGRTASKFAAEDVEAKPTKDLLEVRGGMLGVISCFIKGILRILKCSQ